VLSTNGVALWAWLSYGSVLWSRPMTELDWRTETSLFREVYANEVFIEGQGLPCSCVAYMKSRKPCQRTRAEQLAVVCTLNLPAAYQIARFAMIGTCFTW
jgi:hypothetical protein